MFQVHYQIFIILGVMVIDNPDFHPSTVIVDSGYEFYPAIRQPIVIANCTITTKQSKSECKSIFLMMVYNYVPVAVLSSVVTRNTTLSSNWPPLTITGRIMRGCSSSTRYTFSLNPTTTVPAWGDGSGQEIQFIWTTCCKCFHQRHIIDACTSGTYDR